MAERWIQESEQLLKRMKALSSKEKRDRLEIINSMHFSLNLLGRSLRGWGKWVRNLSLMSQLTLEELAEIQEVLEKQIRPFIEYDIQSTKRWMDKFTVARRTRREREIFRTVV